MAQNCGLQEPTRGAGWNAPATYVATTVYGTTAQAERGRRARLRPAARPAARRSTRARASEFRIDEPDLLRWVHVTEVESFVTTARRAGLALTDDEVDRYYAEQRRAAALVGLDPATVPGSAAEVEAYYQEVRPELRMTRDAAETRAVPDRTAGARQLKLPLRLGLSLGPARLAYFGIAGHGVRAAARLGPRAVRQPGACPPPTCPPS